MSKKGNKYDLTDKQVKFCQEYIIDHNGTQACIRAGYSKKSANEQASQHLAKLNIQNYITDLKNNTANKAGITHEMLTNEWKKIAFSSISHIHNTWIDKTDFEVLKEDNPDILDCIQEIDTKVLKRNIYDAEIKESVIVDVEQIKVKLYDKTKALTELGKHIAYYSEHNKEKAQNVNLVMDAETIKRINKELEDNV